VSAAVKRLLDAASASPATESNGVPQFAPSLIALFGRSGTGKTHLAYGLVRAWQQQRGVDAALYTTAADYRRQFTTALRSDGVCEFRRHIRGRQLFAIDDLHHLPADEYLAQELRYTLDDYEDRGGTVLVTSNRPASTLANLSPDLRSRLAAALLLQLASPGGDARLRIIRQTAAALQQSLSDEAAQRLSAGVTGTASDLIGALFEHCSASRANRVSDDSHASIAARQPTLREIIALVARYTSVPQKELKSGSRKQATVFARAVAIYLARELAGASYQEIGRSLGDRDHTTIMHSYRKIDRDRLSYRDTQEILDELRRLLLNH
jgi:chromosomal replication initiator protein